MASTHSNQYVTEVNVINYNNGKQMLALHKRYQNYTGDGDVTWCKVITASIREKSSSTKAGHAIAYYIDTATHDEEYDEQFSDIRQVCSTANDLVELQVFMTPYQYEMEDDCPEEHCGLVIQELSI